MVLCESFIIIFMIFFIVIWTAVCFILAKVGGWQKLARIYRHDGQFNGKRWHFRSCRMNGYVNYNGCLTFGASSAGLYLKILPLFCFYHPPLLIPWSQIKTEKNNDSSYCKLTFSPIPDIQILISESLCEKILSASRQPQNDVEYRAYRKIEPR